MYKGQGGGMAEELVRVFMCLSVLPYAPQSVWLNGDTQCGTVS